MPTSARCPGCGEPLSLPDGDVGTRAECSSCGAIFTLARKGPRNPVAPPPPGRATVPAAGAQVGTHRPAGETAAARSALDEAGQLRQIGPYILLKWLGQGEIGEVWLAKDLTLDRKIALKVLPFPSAGEKPEVLEERKQRFLREARLAAKLDHPNIVPVYQADFAGEVAYIAMKFIDGPSLDKAVAAAGKPLHWREATRAIRDAAAGLGAAHALGLIHRDVKPGSLMRGADGVTKVVDFGMAREQAGDLALPPTGQTGMIVGTPAFRAPEYWAGAPKIDGRADLYSLMCTYFFLLTGRVPFEVETLPALATYHCNVEFPDPRRFRKGIPRPVREILEKGSRKNPAERYQTGQELVVDLDRALGGRSLSRGGRWLPAVASAAVAAVATAALILWSLIRTADRDTKSVVASPTVKQSPPAAPPGVAPPASPMATPPGFPVTAPQFRPVPDVPAEQIAEAMRRAAAARRVSAAAAQGTSPAPLEVPSGRDPLAMPPAEGSDTKVPRAPSREVARTAPQSPWDDPANVGQEVKLQGRYRRQSGDVVTIELGDAALLQSEAQIQFSNVTKAMLADYRRGDLVDVAGTIAGKGAGPLRHVQIEGRSIVRVANPRSAISEGTREFPPLDFSVDKKRWMTERFGNKDAKTPLRGGGVYGGFAKGSAHLTIKIEQLFFERGELDLLCAADSRNEEFLRDLVPNSEVLFEFTLIDGSSGAIRWLAPIAKPDEQFKPTPVRQPPAAPAKATPKRR